MYNIIGDIAGNFMTLMALIDKMPEGQVISVGDMIDRGPSSDEVLNYFMQNDGEDTRAILGNHEHLMLDFYGQLPNPEQPEKYYGGFDLWGHNGGKATRYHYDPRPPQELLDWIRNLPRYLELEAGDKKYFVSHAFWDPINTLEAVCDLGLYSEDSPHSIIWNRWEPGRQDYDLQIAGHNSQMGLKRFSDDEGEFAICIDTSWEKVLTGIHLPTGQIFQQPYID